MPTKKDKNQPLTEHEKMKYEIAQELGLMDKVNQLGWKGLTAKETGKIGGLMTKKKKEEAKKQVQS
jgi:hypothetical protein